MKFTQKKVIELDDKETEILEEAFKIINTIEEEVGNIEHTAILAGCRYDINEISDVRYMLEEFIKTDYIEID